MVLAAATLFGVNGSVAKVALSSGLSSLRLSEARCAGACVGLMLFTLLHSPGSLRIRDRRELLRLAIFGAGRRCARAALLLLAIHRLAIGIACSSSTSASACRDLGADVRARARSPPHLGRARVSRSAGWP